jgi:DNA polymerase V
MEFVMRVTQLSLKSGSSTHPLFTNTIACGFPSPAEGYIEDPLTLSDLLITNPNATYFAKASGDSMESKGIFNGAILTVDRSKPYIDGCTVIAVVNGELTCKILDLKNSKLVSGHPQYPPIAITEPMDVVLQGVVTWAMNRQ